MKRKLVILTLLLIIIGAAVFFINRALFLTNDPKTEVLRSIENTMGEIAAPDIDIIKLFRAVTADIWRQEIKMTVNRLNTTLFEADPRVLSALQMLTLESITTNARGTPQLYSSLYGSIIATPLAELHMFAEPDIFGIAAPQALGQFITLNPRSVSDEWNRSVLGLYLGGMDNNFLQDAFYAYYNRLLFPQQTGQTAAWPSADVFGPVLEQAAYKYDGKVTVIFGESEWQTDAYTMTVPAEALNECYGSVAAAPAFNPDWPGDIIGQALNRAAEAIRGLRFDGDTVVTLYADGDMIRRVQFSAAVVIGNNTFECTGTMALPGEKPAARLDKIDAQIAVNGGGAAYQISLSAAARVSEPSVTETRWEAAAWDARAEAEPARFSGHFNWDRTQPAGDNLSFALDAALNIDTGLKISTEGRLAAFEETAEQSPSVEADLRRLDVLLQLPQGKWDISLKGEYLLRTAGESLLFNDGEDNQIPLAQITEMDVLEMYAKLLEDPQLSAILGMFN
jgi:hypothetical protein